ncbi:glycerol-3-phosphate acyltransferase [Pseudoflavonifractor sp. 60]|uniref:glycerol-3-phosphate acyltransferase n=1 Tax=Pseudoflavonifractor sp. 60 TaxID=2304576 RepID=UPI001367B20C|nr:glycerol-3-phosphate acyltransferase [Pseudoflavonifractor sp. 60]NBI67810.1 glycerol-3-phosphate acyltransferase [Pseudoflavonifractor sp. 60]
MYDKLTELFRPIYIFIMAIAAIEILFWLAVIALTAYFLGCFNGAVIISNYILHDDIRTHGSGSAGLTNFYRTFGGPLTLGVILCDVLTAVLAVGFGAFVFYFILLVTRPDYMIFAKYWAGLWCLLGHMFPCMFRFKGGKGILSGGTIAIMLDWRLALLVWGGFLILAVLTRYVSLGSVFAAAAFPVGTWLFVSHNPVMMALALSLGGLVLYIHRANIHRLLTGTEHKFSLHKKK